MAAIRQLRPRGSTGQFHPCDQTAAMSVVAVPGGHVDDLVGGAVVAAAAALLEGGQSGQQEGHHADGQGLAGHHGYGAQAESAHHAAAEAEGPSQSGAGTFPLTSCNKEMPILKDNNLYCKANSRLIFE